MNDHVLVGDGALRAIFRSPVPPASDDPYAGASFEFELHADGLSVRRTVFMMGFGWKSLPDYFNDLAESWRGWDGVKVWESIEHDLSIRATSDQLGHVLLDFTVRDGGMGSWQAEVEGFSVAAGEDMATIAADLQRWASDSRN